MEGLGGLGLLRQLREQQSATAVVLMTAYATVPQAVEAMHLGAYEFLMKPFSPDDVRLLINHVLDARTSHRDHATVRREVDHASEPSTVATESATEEELSLKDLERRRIEEVWRGHRRLMPPRPARYRSGDPVAEAETVRNGVIMNLQRTDSNNTGG